MNAIHIFVIALVLAIVGCTVLIARAVQVSNRIQRGDW